MNIQSAHFQYNPTFDNTHVLTYLIMVLLEEAIAILILSNLGVFSLLYNVAPKVPRQLFCCKSNKIPKALP